MADRRQGHGGYFTPFGRFVNTQGSISAAQRAAGQIYPNEEEEYNKRDEQAARAQAFASLVALAERSSVLDVSIGTGSIRNPVQSWYVTVEFNSGDLLDAVADSPEAAVKAVEEKMQEREDIQSGLMEDT
jgi:hypothetical protein